MASKKKIYQGLAIDGGGILGIGSARALMEFEKNSGKPIIEQFDFIMGTSTGGIIAVMLSIGYSAEEIYNLYLEKGDDIFYIPGIIWRYNPLNPKYSNERFKLILDEYLGTKTMKDLKIPTFIPTSNIVKKTTHVFSIKHDDLLKDVILKTTAAPTYFPPQGEWIDGGIWANDPSLVGTLGFKKATGCGFDQIKVLSIGTSGDPDEKSLDPKNLTKFEWVAPLLSFLLVGIEYANEFFMNNLGLNTYERIDPKFKEDFAMDNLEKMKDYAEIWEDIYEANKTRFEKFFR